MGDFGDRLKAGGGVGLFYFAGHGVQVRGENFLVSTDSDTRREDAVANDSLNANTVPEKMQTAGNRVNLVILDAGRENPLPSGRRSAAEGLAGMRAPSGSLVAYSTRAGLGRAGRHRPQRALRRNPGQGDSPPGPAGRGRLQAGAHRRSQAKQQPANPLGKHGAGRAVCLQRPARSGPSRYRGAGPGFLGKRQIQQFPPADLQAYLSQYPAGRVCRPGASAACAAEGGRIEQGVGARRVRTCGHAGECTDRAYGQRSSVAVTISQRNDQRTVYSSGDIIASGGRIEQLRVGDVVVKVTSGAL